MKTKTLYVDTGHQLPETTQITHISAKTCHSLTFCGFRGKPIGIPGRCRSRFRDEADQRSDAMPISDRAFSES